MVRALPYMFASAFLLFLAPAHADFLLQSPSGDTGLEILDSHTAAQPAPSVAESSQPVRWKIAYGFGNGIPLAFACRQIVPRAVKVSYGPGVDQTAPVTWKGGDTWNHVLRDSVEPLGLNLQMTYMAVTIVKNPP